MSEQPNQSMRLLLRAQQGDTSAMDELVSTNLALVKFVVKRYIGRGLEYDDLYQLGCLGLVKAIKNFNTEYAVQFSTYAVPVILGEIRRYLRDNCLMRVSRSIRENALRIHRYREQYELENAREPTVDELANALDLSRDDALLALDSLLPARSLSEPIGEGGITLGDTVGEDPTAALDDSITLDQMLACLSEKERVILTRRYMSGNTQASIARDLGMTQVQVSRMEGRIIKRLRELTQASGQ